MRLYLFLSQQFQFASPRPCPLSQQSQWEVKEMLLMLVVIGGEMVQEEMA
jgi:hypothetical protein